ncbi:hypothetical protein ACIP97_16240 [Peribacillus frigoritolerans]|uniref:hypothetical protein n=1 Tax=Peribacillus frigoritolerans TaxID=450367 RepID=UPI0038264293
MGFRYDMKDKTGQQQAIVRARDEAEKRREQENSDEIKCSPSPRTADFEGVYFTKNNIPLLELRVSGTAMVNGSCNLKKVKIHDWLCKTGRSFIGQVKEFEVLTITSYDVLDKKLITDWKNLRREALTPENPNGHGGTIRP